MKINVPLYDVKPFWNQGSRPRFLSRTETKYARAPLSSILEERGLNNRLLESLITLLPKGAIIAGGFMTAVMGETKDAHDIDIFFTSEEAFRQTFKLLMDSQNQEEFDDESWAWTGYELDTDPDALGSTETLRYVKFVPKDHTKRLPIQLIKLVWYDDPEHVIDSFDLTVAQFATDGTDIIMNPMAPIDLARKRLVLHRMQFPASTLRRVIKYTNKGFYACPGSLTKIAAEVANTIKQDPSSNDNVVYID